MTIENCYYLLSYPYSGKEILNVKPLKYAEDQNGAEISGIYEKLPKQLTKLHNSYSHSAKNLRLSETKTNLNSSTCDNSAFCTWIKRLQ